jgi:hypothetical protein
VIQLQYLPLINDNINLEESLVKEENESNKPLRRFQIQEKVRFKFQLPVFRGILSLIHSLHFNTYKLIRFLAMAVGNAMEWYDFAIFGALADVIGDTLCIEFVECLLFA